MAKRCGVFDVRGVRCGALQRGGNAGNGGDRGAAHGGREAQRRRVVGRVPEVAARDGDGRARWTCARAIVVVAAAARRARAEDSGAELAWVAPAG